MQINNDAEVTNNYAAFVAILPRFLGSHRGQFALLHHERIQGFFSDAVQAFSHGYKEFGEGNFSVQQVTDEVEDLGFYSYAGRAGQA